MFHAKPLNPTTSQSQQWPLTSQDHNNLRQSQNTLAKQIPVKFYLPDDEIRRSTILADCTLQRITDQIKNYASVADKDILLAWNDDQNEWIRFDTDSEFNDAMNHARSLLTVGGVFKVKAKEGKAPVKKQQQPEQQPIQEPKPIAQQPPIQQPVQPIFTPPVQPPSQPPVNQPPFHQPQYPYNPQPIRSPIQPMMQPMMNQPMMTMNQPQMQPMSFGQPQIQSSMPVARGSSPYSTPNKTLTNSVTMQQPHPLNSSFGSPSQIVNQPMVQNSPVQPPQQQPQPQQPVQQLVQQPSQQVDPNSLGMLRGFGFGYDDSILIKALQDAKGDINVAADNLLTRQ